MKNHVKQNNKTYKLNHAQKLINEGIQKMTSDMWATFVSHTIKEEDKLYGIDFICDEILDDEASHIMSITGDISSNSSNLYFL